MIPRLKYHFEPAKGWINDPNGLVYFNGMYHAFFQHYPHAPHWGPMHWGHTVSKNLIDWEELPIALYPDKEYEQQKDGGGCFSGSAVVCEGVLYLFYTSVSKELGQTQSVAMSRDGVHFEKYENNPVIRSFPEDGSGDFRDPKVTEIDGIYYMVVGSGRDDVAKILLYRSDNLLDWAYIGVLFEGAEYGKVAECPDLFPLGDKYVLMFSNLKTLCSEFIYGDFDGRKFTPISSQRIENGPCFYAPQSFLDPAGRRIVIGWLYSWAKTVEEGAEYAGALTIPRELTITANGKLRLFPVSEAAKLLAQRDEAVQADRHGVVMHPAALNPDTPAKPLEYRGDIKSIDILRDTKTIEVFINKGETSFSYWI